MTKFTVFMGGNKVGDEKKTKFLKLLLKILDIVCFLLTCVP